MKPQPLPTFVRKSGKVHIRADVDAHYRKALREGVSSHGGEKARYHILLALENGPSRGGYAESAAFFGAEWDIKLKLTAPVVDGMEVSVPGFKRWLEVTGFGNDLRMIRGFVCWAEHDPRALFVPAAARVHDQALIGQAGNA